MDSDDEYGSSGPNDDKDSYIDDWYEEGKNEGQIKNKNKGKKEPTEESEDEEESEDKESSDQKDSDSQEEADSDQDDLVNGHEYEEQLQQQRREAARMDPKRKPKLRGMDPMYDGKADIK